jgi:hypothetical protein
VSKLNEAMNRAYSTRPLEFQTATSELFDCDFATRDDGLVLQFRPHMESQVNKLLAAAKDAFADVLGHRASELLTAEVVRDADFGIDPNVFVRVADFAENPSAARSVFERGIRGTYERLKVAVG